MISSIPQFAAQNGEYLLHQLVYPETGISTNAPPTQLAYERMVAQAPKVACEPLVISCNLVNHGLNLVNLVNLVNN